jgi:hypothetical protein
MRQELSARISLKNSGLESREYGHADHVASSIRKKLELTPPRSGGRSVGIVRSRTQATMFISFKIISIWRMRSVDVAKFSGLLVQAHIVCSRHLQRTEVQPKDKITSP